jgi:hypothetical protein
MDYLKQMVLSYKKPGKSVSILEYWKFSVPEATTTTRNGRTVGDSEVTELLSKLKNHV